LVCNKFPFVGLLGGGFVVPSETTFKPLPFYLELCKCNKFPFVGLLGGGFAVPSETTF
jgi:hypothetical protein